MRSPDPEQASATRSRLSWLLEKDLRELLASRSWWLLLLVVSALVGHAFMTSASLYAEASGSGGGAAALSQGLSPLEGIVVPTFGAYDLASTLLFPFVVIRMVAAEKGSGALSLALQAPVAFGLTVAVQGLVLLIAWCIALVPGVSALLLWRLMGGHLYLPETSTVLLGYLLRGVVTIGVGAAAAALAAGASSAAIVALAITLGTWALDYVAAARGGAIATVAAYTPWAALRVFEHGELRVATLCVLLALGVGGLAVASCWLPSGRPVLHRIVRVLVVVAGTVALCVMFARIRSSVDTSEDQRNSFPAADRAALAAIAQPLDVTVYLAAEDPRLADLERGVLAKLRRTMRTVHVTYAAGSRSGLFERPADHYGEVWYELNGRREMSRSATEEIVLETVYRLAGRAPPAPVPATPYSGYPLRVHPGSAPWVFFVLWPLLICGTWFLVRRPGVHRLQSGD